MIGFVFSHLEYFVVLAAVAAAVFAVLTWVPKPLRKWLYGAIAVVALILLGGFALADFKAHYISVGNTQCEDRHIVQKAAAKTKTVEKQIKYGNEGQKVEDEARKQEGVDDPANKYLRYILGVMQERQ